MAMGLRDGPEILEGRSTLAEYNRVASKALKYAPGEAFSHHPIRQDEADWRGYTPQIFRTRIVINKDLINMALKLPEAFPSAPHRLPKHCLYFRRDGKNIATVNFAQTYSARRFLDEVIQDHKPRWRDDDSFVVEDLDHLVVKCSELEDIVEYKLSSKEKEWELPEPYDAQVVSIRTGERIVIRPKKGRHADGDRDDPPRRTKDGITVSEDIERSKRKASKRSAPDGYISLADICSELKVEPRVARQTLRKHMDTPEHGWAFAAKEVDKIKKLIKGGK